MFDAADAGVSSTSAASDQPSRSASSGTFLETATSAVRMKNETKLTVPGMRQQNAKLLHEIMRWSWDDMMHWCRWSHKIVVKEVCDVCYLAPISSDCSKALGRFQKVAQQIVSHIRSTRQEGLVGSTKLLTCVAMQSKAGASFLDVSILRWMLNAYMRPCEARRCLRKIAREWYNVHNEMRYMSTSCRSPLRRFPYPWKVFPYPWKVTNSRHDLENMMEALDTWPRLISEERESWDLAASWYPCKG